MDHAGIRIHAGFQPQLLKYMVPGVSMCEFTQEEQYGDVIWNNFDHVTKRNMTMILARILWTSVVRSSQGYNLLVLL